MKTKEKLNTEQSAKRLSDIRKEIYNLLKEYNETSEDIGLDSHLALIDGTFEVEFGEQEDEDSTAWASSRWCS